jgi:Na+/H+-dicarboxylate symporter
LSIYFDFSLSKENRYFAIMKRLALHWQILLGIILGALLGILLGQFSWGPEILKDWIKPVGTIFIRLLKMIAVPLVIISLAKGITDLGDVTALSRIGGRTIGLYLFTTVVAVILGLTLVNLFEPGSYVSSETLMELSKDFQTSAQEKMSNINESPEKGPLDFFVELVPENFFNSTGDNSKMLQIIFFVVFFAVCLLLLPAEQQYPLKQVFDSANAVLLKMVDGIMYVAPYAVFALIAALVAETSNGELFKALLSYALLLTFGMGILLAFYTFLVYWYTGKSPRFFLQGILPAQLVALSTSSSMATLPVTMECVEENLGVEQEVSSFVCPVGATVNMDATSLMQAIAAVFVCQVLGHDLSIGDQLTIVLTATLASIGAAAAPSAGVVMLVIVLESVNFPSGSLAVALAMILSVDRPLDMLRTVVNISGDSCVSVLVAKSLGKLR